MDATYSMPSTIGLIALSGIVVRNSILLIEFIHMKSREGVPMRTAALEAAAIRAKPIFLTALAGIAGSAFILPDAMLHGMGVWSRLVDDTHFNRDTGDVCLAAR